MKVHKRYIIIRNGTDLRLVANRPTLAANEVAILITIKAPTPPRIIGEVELDLPEPPPAVVDATVVEYEEAESAESVS